MADENNDTCNEPYDVLVTYEMLNGGYAVLRPDLAVRVAPDGVVDFVHDSVEGLRG